MIGLRIGVGQNQLAKTVTYNPLFWRISIVLTRAINGVY